MRSKDSAVSSPNPAKIFGDPAPKISRTMQDPEEEDDDQQQQHPAARRCAACRYLRRRCADDCVLAPFFPASRPHRYACVHRVFGASNVARLLQSLPMAERGNAANTMAMEAYWRVQDPVYGCTGIINRLQEEIRAVQCELARTQAHLAIAVASSQQPPPPPPPPPLPSPPPPPPVVASPPCARLLLHILMREKRDGKKMALCSG